MTKENADRGRSNRRKGNGFRDAAVLALRTAGWSDATAQTSHGRNDISGGPAEIGIECKDTLDWSEINNMLGQAARDAAERKIAWSLVWKKFRGHGDPMDGFVVWRARTFFAYANHVAELEQAVAGFEAAARAAAGSPEVWA